MIDGGTTTLQMCAHLAGLNLQVLTNSLHIVDTLLPQEGTRILVPSGTVFREQNIILAAAGEESMPRFHAPRLFMGAASVGPQGVMQADVILVAAERRLIDRADEVILLVDSSKFRTQSGAIVCSLEEIHTLITDAVPPEMEQATHRCRCESHRCPVGPGKVTAFCVFRRRRWVLCPRCMRPGLRAAFMVTPFNRFTSSAGLQIVSGRAVHPIR